MAEGGRMKHFITVVLIGIATVAMAGLQEDYVTQSQLLNKELSRLDQLQQAVIQQTAIVNQRRGIVSYIQYQIDQEKKADELYKNDKPIGESGVPAP